MTERIARRVCAACLALLLLSGCAAQPQQKPEPEPPVSVQPSDPEPPAEGTEPPVEDPEPPAEDPEPPAEEPEPPVEEPEAPAEEPEPPQDGAPLTVSDPEAVQQELAAAIRQLRQPGCMELSGFTFEHPEMDVKNLYYALTSKNPELKYAYDLSVELEGTQLRCSVSYMPYKTGAYPADFAGTEVSSLQELIAVAQQNLGEEPVPIRITNTALTPDDMNRALQQAGGGYLYCGLNRDATALVFSAPMGMSIADCLDALREADALADAVIAQCVTPDMDEREKAQALYTYVTQHVAYDRRYYNDRASMPYESQTALGALRDGTAICGGYSHALKLLFEKVGLTCYNVTGSCNRENHMWNLARLDGQWLWFDATADRGCSPESGFRHFALEELDTRSYQWKPEEVALLLDA